MAKDKEDDAVAMSPETIAMIEDQVKKGKARKFFLIHKGASIKTLEVFKKGAFGPKVTQAKKNGFKGDVVYGVVAGSGVNLYFYLAANGDVAAAMKVDGFADSPPTKASKLREFLTDNNLKLKPSFHLIRNTADAPDPENEADAALGPPPAGSEMDGDEDVSPNASSSVPDSVPDADESTPSESDEASESNVSSDDLAASFADRFKLILPKIKAAVGTTAGEEAKVKASEAVALSRNRDFVQAHSVLDQIDSLLATANNKEDDQAAKFNDRLKTMLPSIKAAIGTPQGDSIKLLASEAGAFARGKKFEDGHRLLDQIETLLGKATEKSNSPTPTSDLEATLALWKKVKIEILTKLNEELKWVVSTKDPLAAGAELELRAVMKQINGTLATRQQSNELVRYLDQDDIVEDVCELAFDIKTPLLQVLRNIQPQLPA